MKILFSSALALISVPALATQITSPFFLPQAGHVLSETSAFFTKNKIKTNLTARTYHQQMDEKLTIGLGSGWAAMIQGNLNWTRQKQTLTFSFPHTKAYGAGLKGQWETEDFLTQITTLYYQTTNIYFDPRRQIETHLRFGKTLKTMTPYVHLTATIPLNAREEQNDPIYRAETGVFQPIKTSMTLDSALYLQYDKNTKGRSYGIRSEWSYSITPDIAFSVNGEWQARGHTKNNGHTYHQSIGSKITFSF